MTITIDPASAAAFIAILLTAAGASICFSRLSNRLDTLESDLKELKTDVKQILVMLNTHMGYHQGLIATAEPSDENH